MSDSIRSRVFYAIRNFDVELAEAFAARCPEIKTIAELNCVFHRLLTQYDLETQHLRSTLSDDIDLNEWLRCFFSDGVFKFIVQHRLPPLTGNWNWGAYTNQSLEQRG